MASFDKMPRKCLYGCACFMPTSATQILLTMMVCIEPESERAHPQHPKNEYVLKSRVLYSRRIPFHPPSPPLKFTGDSIAVQTTHIIWRHESFIDLHLQIATLLGMYQNQIPQRESFCIADGMRRSLVWRIHKQARRTQKQRKINGVLH